MCDFPADQHRCAMGGCHNGTHKTFCGDHAHLETLALMGVPDDAPPSHLDPRIIGNAEGNRKIRDADRAAARRELDNTRPYETSGRSGGCERQSP